MSAHELNEEFDETDVGETLDVLATAIIEQLRSAVKVLSPRDDQHLRAVVVHISEAILVLDQLYAMAQVMKEDWSALQ